MKPGSYGYRTQEGPERRNTVLLSLWGGLLLCLLLGGGAAPAHGQLKTEGGLQEERRERGRAQDSQVQEVPSWAESRRSDGATRRSDRPERLTEHVEPKGPDLPPPGSRRVPIGGLGWLIAAGMGYGVWRLRD